MVDFNVEWNKENVWDFVKFNTLYRGRKQRFLIYSYAVCFIVVLAAGIVAFAVTKEMMLLFIALAALLIFAAYFFVFMGMMKSFAKKILAENASDKTTVSVTDLDIVVYDNGTPVGKVDWSSITQISVNKNAVYLITKENALLLLEYSSITSGTREEFDRIIEEKNAELSKKA